MSQRLRSESPLSKGSREKPNAKGQAGSYHIKDKMEDGAKAQLSAAFKVNQADTRAWELCTDVPIVKNIYSYICFILNIVIPGTGTMVAACLGGDEGKGGNKT